MKVHCCIRKAKLESKQQKFCNFNQIKEIQRVLKLKYLKRSFIKLDHKIFAF